MQWGVVAPPRRAWRYGADALVFSRLSGAIASSAIFQCPSAFSRTYTRDCVLDAGGKTCPPTIEGVGVGGTADLCVHLSKVAATRALGTHCQDAEGAKLEDELTRVVNTLGVGPQGLGGDCTAFAVHVEIAATHITMNPVAVNMQCHSARRARATFTPAGVEYGF